MIDISDIRKRASEEILAELRQSYDKSLASSIEHNMDYWRSHRSSIALLVIEGLNKRYSSKLKSVFELQDYHMVSAQLLFALYAESEMDIIHAALESDDVQRLHNAVTASYITRMQIADYILRSKELTNLMYFMNPTRVNKWVPERITAEMNCLHEPITSTLSAESLLQELRGLIKDLSCRHSEYKTDTYFELSKDKHIKEELFVA